MDAKTETEKKSTSIIGSLKKLAFTLMVLAVLWFGLRYVLMPAMFKNPQQAPALVADDARITALEERIAKLEMAAPPAPQTVDVSPLEARIAKLEETPPASSPAHTIDNEEVTALKMEIEALKDDNHKAIKTLLAADKLANALRDGSPFASEMEFYLTLAPEKKEAFVPIETAANTGIATLASLQTQFSTTLHGALSQSTKEKTFASNFASLIKIRKVGEAQKGKDDGAVLARAEAKIARGDVAACLQEIEALSPSARAAFDNFVTRAKAYLVAVQLARTLRDIP